MIPLPETFIRRVPLLRPILFLMAAYIIFIGFFLRGYLSVGSASFILGLMAVPVIIQATEPGVQSNRYGWLTLLLLVLTLFIPVKTFLYFTACFSLVWVWERCIGKTTVSLPAVVILASPAFQYLVSLSGFSIRLHLTSVAARLFELTGSDVSVAGNVITYAGKEYSVDPACMGLSMLTTSLLLGLILLSFFQSAGKRRVKSRAVLLFLTLSLLLNIVGNLLRIVLLVRLDIKPGTVSHDAAGLLCLLIYVIIPGLFIARYIVRRSPAAVAGPAHRSSLTALHWIVLSMILLAGWRVNTVDTFQPFTAPTEIDNYAITEYAPGILKMENAASLIYLKKIRGFYDADHNPAICWRGSGYQFEGVHQQIVDSQPMTTASLVRGSEKLYTAWWYTNGLNQTTSQWEWRADMLNGSKDYLLVNITSSSAGQLLAEIRKLQGANTLSPFFPKRNPVQQTTETSTRINGQFSLLNLCKRMLTAPLEIKTHRKIPHRLATEEPVHLPGCIYP